LCSNANNQFSLKQATTNEIWLTSALFMSGKILYISYDGMTDPLGQSQVLPYLAGLTRLGYQFHLISFEKPDRYDKFREHIGRICHEAGIVWHPLKYTSKPPVISTLKDVRKMRRLAADLHTEHQFDVVHCRSYIAALVGLGMKKRVGTKFVFDMRGFWADERVDGGIWNLNHPLYRMVYRYFKRKEIEFLEQADQIVSLTQRAKQEMESWSSVNRANLPITVIPCCVDLELFNPQRILPAEQDELRHRLGIKSEEVVLGYVGSIGTWYMLDEMLDFFTYFFQKNPSAKFLFVTGESPDVILQKAENKGIERKRLVITSTTHQLVPLHISLFDLSVFFIRPTYSKMASSPTKQGEIMAMGVPLVCNAGVGDTDEIVRRYEAGVVLPELDAPHYEANCSFPFTYSRDLTQLGAKEVYGLARGVELYASVYDALKS
jgi:glycosyltransferase involved in cell wall biosynthesis